MKDMKWLWLTPLRVVVSAMGILGVSSVMCEPGHAGTIVAVSAKAGPWSYVPGGLNTLYQYGVGDQSAAASVSAADGLPFAPGNFLTVTYVSGGTDPYGLGCVVYCYDGNGTGAQNNFPGSSDKIMPSYYIPVAEYDVGLMALVGVFTDDGGALVGTPHKLGNGPTTLAIPVGAARFQMGLNDDIYRDNFGSLTVDVSVSPEPSTWMLLTAGSMIVAAKLRLKRRKR